MTKDLETFFAQLELDTLGMIARDISRLRKQEPDENHKRHYVQQLNVLNEMIGEKL